MYHTGCLKEVSFTKLRPTADPAGGWGEKSKLLLGRSAPPTSPVLKCPGLNKKLFFGGAGTSLNPFGATSFQTKIDIVLQRYPALVLGLRISPIPVRKGFSKLLFHLSHVEAVPGEQGPFFSMYAAHPVFPLWGTTCFTYRGSMNFPNFDVSPFIYQTLQGATQTFFFFLC